MTLDELYNLIRGELDFEEIAAFAGEFHRYPLKLSFSSYAEGIEFLAERYRGIGLETEVVSFPADGKTVYADRHFPLAWDVDEAWAEVNGIRVADYGECTYCVVPFSAHSGGVCEGVIVPQEKLPAEGSLEGIVALITHYPSGTEIQQLMERSCKAFMVAVDLVPIHPSLEDSRRWFNDLFGAGQIDYRDQTCIGFSLTPRLARELAAKYEKSGPVPARYLMKTRTYEGKVPAVTALLKGESDRCFFLTAHAYEPHATNDIAGVSALFAAAKVLSKLIAEGRLPRPKYSIRFFHGLENFSLYAWGMSHRDEMKNAVGGLSLDSFGRLEAEGKREHFVLRRSLNVHPSNQHALAREILSLGNIGFEAREGSKNNEDLMQDPMFGPPWNLLYGSLWEEPRETYPRCYFYHTSNDTPDKLSPEALGAAAAFAATLAYCGEGDAHLALTDWKRIVDDKCREALRLTENGSRMLRAQRLAVWRKLALGSGAKAIGDPELARQFTAYAGKQFDAAILLLNGGEPPALKSEEHKDILIRTVPGPIGLGTIDESLRGLAAEAQGYESEEYWCLDDSGTNFYHFDGWKTVFEAALAAWATRIYSEHENPDDLDHEITHYSKLAEVLLKSGLAVHKETPVVTKDEITAGLRRLDIEAGDMVMVHSSLKSFGEVAGGADVVIAALEEVITPDGILAMPAFTDCEDGSPNPAYHPDLPVEKWIGIIPETFRKRPGVLRSGHPTHSVCAWGKNAAGFLAQESPYDTFAPDGPWGKLRERGGKVLFLGEANGGNTFLHATEAWFNTYLDRTYARTGGKTVMVDNYPGGCRGGWYKLGRQAEYYRKLEERGIFHQTQVGPAVLTIYHAHEFAEAMKIIFAENPAILLHRSGCRECAKHRSMIR